MNKLTYVLILLLIPVLALAEEGSALSFAPPATDVSVIFLGNMFGIVDGILHGNGSQIMGTIFGVFNSAVLALGGIVILYTLIVSTLNTAHEGQMLGQKWSSIWIPIRSTLGLALLIPKASGYCLMQIFVMWIVVQGVGAADKVWNAALSYLNRGGVIIQAQANPGLALLNAGNSGVATGALKILTGQVCMLGIQNQLTKIRKNYLERKGRDFGPCSGTPTAVMAKFCNTAVPDFISTVNAIDTQDKDTKREQPYYTVSMPSFDSKSPYFFLNGICGTIQWNPIEQLKSYNSKVGSTTTVQYNPDIQGTPRPGEPSMVQAAPDVAIPAGTTYTSETTNANLSASELETSQMARAVAVQQMYVSLSSIAQLIVNNDPQLSTNTNNGSVENNFSPLAKQQFGVPYTGSGVICKSYAEKCKIWGAVPSETNTSVLFNGTEFQGAISDYNGVMAPTVNLIKQIQASAGEKNSKEFIANASNQGWMMAGAYFFDLVKINSPEGSALSSRDQADTKTGLDSSQFKLEDLTSAFADLGCTGQYANLCTWFDGNSSYMNQIKSLIDGSSLGDKVGQPELAPTNSTASVVSKSSSTVYGFVTNSVIIQLPDQPGTGPVDIGDIINFKIDQVPEAPWLQFDCGGIWIFGEICIGEKIGDVLYNWIFRTVYNLFLKAFGKLINMVIMTFVMVPLQGMGEIFKVGMQGVSSVGSNPVIALASMGVMYINFAGSLWIILINVSIVASLLPIFGKFVFALVALAMPLVMAWLGLMLTTGFITAYYIPVLPYIIFTLGSLAWFILVIEAMVAAPIVALGVTHPEGHDAFGKGEHAIMLLMNIFLRPSMMIIGFISGIALTYIGVWILNTGFEHAIGYVQQKGNSKSTTSGTGGYSEWAGIYAYFFALLVYTGMYVLIVQKSFTLISYLPDKILRWIGGSPESLGTEAAGWGEEIKRDQIDKAGTGTQQAQGQMGKQMGGYAQKGISAGMGAIKGALGGGGKTSGKGGEGGQTGPSSTPSSGGSPPAPPVPPG